ncbi:ECF transporter S component [Weissella diestrammenae]|uniref:ECF transporter S component n=1 Tax=Weissella diestrammenae TaxID=1162633 RepID=A0A7G9T682_9LACO|nr:ECF transporter S component [Weissella diestrammenae]MCM0583349.1 ECF transporter S component [Weissella diestrammenae]QNN75607.1 ECF transporter S component [Weissella diestrammenae]
MQQTNATRKLVLTAMFIALILLQCFVPWLGYIPINPVVQVTIIPFTIALGGMALGPKVGGMLGFIMGLYSLYNAWTMPVSIGALMFRNPITAIVPRILVGVIVGIVYANFIRNRTFKVKAISLFGLGALAALTNTFFVMVITWVGFSLMHTTFTGLPDNVGIVWLFTSLAGFNAIVELVVDGILGLLVGMPVLTYLAKFTA